MSPSGSESKMPGVKGRKVPGKPGRFDPSMPMHMTTRRAAKTTTTNGSPSINGSPEDNASRRASFDDHRPTTSHSQLSQPSQASPNAMQHEAPELNKPTSPAASPTYPTYLMQVDEESNHPSGPVPLTEQAATPSRKRKRPTASPPATTPNGFIASPMSTPPGPSSDEDAPPSSDEEEEAALSAAEQLSDREMSAASSQSDEQEDEAIAVATASADITPAISVVVSPASSVSGSDNVPKAKVADDTADVVMQDDGIELIAEAEDIDDNEEVYDQPRSGDEARPVRKIGGRRRRAAHPNDDVEIALRRQLEVKKGFRAIARELKGVLAELSLRTLDELRSNENSHLEASEHANVEASLDAALAERKRLIQTQHQLDMDLLKQKLYDEQQVRKATYRTLVENGRQAAIDNLQHKALSVVRQAQQQQLDAGNETEDEDDDVIPRPKRAAYRFRRGEALDNVYESRSRLAIETERSMDDIQRRLRMRNTLQKLDEQEMHTKPLFAVMDRATRDAANVRQEEAAGTQTLAAAASHVQEADKLMVRNEDALGLQLLSDLCTRPSITAPHEHMMQQKSNMQPVARTPRPPPLPNIQPPANPPIAVELSPRTAQIFRERQENQMPPPRTPRQSDAGFGNAFEGPRPEQMLSSPARTQPQHGLPLIAARPAETDGRESHERSPARHRNEPYGFPFDFGARFGPPAQRPDELSSPMRSAFAHEPERPQSVTGVPDRRSRSIDERPPFDFMRRTPLPATERPNSIHDRTRGDDKRERSPSREPWPRSILHDRPPLFDRPRSPPAGVGGNGPPFGSSSTERRPGPPLVNPGVSGYGPAPVSIKHEDRDEAAGGAPRPWKSGNNFRKTSKTERHGLSRRQAKRGGFEKKRNERSNSFGGPATGQRPQQGNEGPGDREIKQEPQPWHARPNDHPPFPPPHSQGMPPPAFPPTTHFGHPPPPPPQYGPYGQGPPDFGHPHHHRNSYPPPQPGPPGWSGPPPSPLYAIPHQPPSSQPHQPPPPGVEHYPGPHSFGPLPPPPPAGYHSQPQTPMTPQPMSAPGSSYGQQFGGPAIAPATDPRFGTPGFRPGLPAFAQQRNSEGSRRRAQSDAHISWRPYHGPPNQR